MTRNVLPHNIFTGEGTALTVALLLTALVTVAAFPALTTGNLELAPATELSDSHPASTPPATPHFTVACR